MLVREGNARSDEVDRRLAATLAAVAGALNAAAFHAVGFFSANMTGNLSALSDQLALGRLGPAGFLAAIVACFVSGAIATTLLTSAGRRRRLHGVYARAVLIEAALLALLGLLDLGLDGPARVAMFVLGLSFLMGMQNAVVTRISDARVRTTHISGMATDIGIGLGLLIDVARGREPAHGAEAVRAKLRLHVETVLAFFAGGIAGVLLYRLAGGLLLVGVAGLLALIALPVVRRGRGDGGR